MARTHLFHTRLHCHHQDKASPWQHHNAQFPTIRWLRTTDLGDGEALGRVRLRARTPAVSVRHPQQCPWVQQPLPEALGFLAENPASPLAAATSRHKSAAKVRLCVTLPFSQRGRPWSPRRPQDDHSLPEDHRGTRAREVQTDAGTARAGDFNGNSPAWKSFLKTKPKKMLFSLCLTSLL